MLACRKIDHNCGSHNGSRSKMITIVTGDLREAKEEYIAQQCCCTAIKPHGLSLGMGVP